MPVGRRSLFPFLCFVMLPTMASAQSRVTPDEARAIAKEAYVFNYPLVMYYRTKPTWIRLGSCRSSSR